MREDKLISIGKAAQMLGVSIETLRRWDKNKKLIPIISPKGQRKYLQAEIKALISNTSLFSEAFAWASQEIAQTPKKEYYCQNSSDFQFQVKNLENQLSQMKDLQDFFPLIVAAVGEIGNNSFDHNLGNWSNIPGIFFAVDISRRQIILADRGQGILKTLKRVKPELENDEQALRTAFTEILSGRAPEERGNGLKFVKRIIPLAHISLFFQTGNAIIQLTEKNYTINPTKSNRTVKGCFALITF